MTGKGMGFAALGKRGNPIAGKFKGLVDRAAGSPYHLARKSPAVPISCLGGKEAQCSPTPAASH